MDFLVFSTYFRLLLSTDDNCRLGDYKKLKSKVLALHAQKYSAPGDWDSYEKDMAARKHVVDLMFKRFDADGSGKVSSSELSQVSDIKNDFQCIYQQNWWRRLFQSLAITALRFQWEIISFLLDCDAILVNSSWKTIFNSPWFFFSRLASKHLYLLFRNQFWVILAVHLGSF